MAAQRAQAARLLALGDAAHYEALQVDERASTAQLKAAFRRLARLIHPDKCKQPACPPAFLKLQAAHEVLSDAEKRAEHDRARALERRYHYAHVNDFGLHASRGRSPGPGGAGGAGRARSHAGAYRKPQARTQSFRW